VDFVLQRQPAQWEHADYPRWHTANHAGKPQLFSSLYVPVLGRVAYRLTSGTRPSLQLDISMRRLATEEDKAESQRETLAAAQAGLDSGPQAVVPWPEAALSKVRLTPLVQLRPIQCALTGIVATLARLLRSS
jgi:hypothetical protein